MSSFSKNFNKILAEAYHSILLLKETKKKYSKGNLSFRDRNTITYLSNIEGGKKISDIGDYLKISRPSATSVVKKLEKLGLVEKRINPCNKRSIIVTLTRRGRLFSAFQHRYRQRLAEAVCEGFSEEEQKAFYKGLSKLNEFFIDSIEESEKIHGKDKE
ncbi:MAG: MarR family transcriptional regulator [Eubacteriales bacterium]|nr:MarR family transcriptional regulator [Eubacteriales bacterium]